MVKIPQHKVTKSILIDNGLFKYSTCAATKDAGIVYRFFGLLAVNVTKVFNTREKGSAD